MTAARGFDLLGPMPTGTTVLEASAGTGKTYAIVGLAARYIAEGIAEISDLLLVTFSRAATQELRDRTRSRFASIARDLAEPDTARASRDPLVAFLAAVDDAEVDRRRRRLRRALSDFDAGTIVTTHSFCQRMLDGLGIAGEREPESAFVESVSDLLEQVVDDLYLQMFSGDDEAPAFSRRDAQQLALAAVGDQQSILYPDTEDLDDSNREPGLRVRFAREARREIERRKRLLGVRDYNDLLGLLHSVLSDPVHGEAACARVRDRFRVVLIDEFQDTDPMQWDILRRAFHGFTTLILVGDPKQAIYAFRGAEVLSYLDAVQTADHLYELTANWRSDSGLLDALHHLYGGAALGHDDIVVHRVEARNPLSRMVGHPPLRLRYLPRTGAGPLRQGFPAVDRLRSRVAADVAADIVELLSGHAVIERPDGPRVIGPRDIAVLTRTTKQVALIRDALDAVGVPSVVSSSTSVFGTESARHWLWLLQAIEQPHRTDRVRLAALTPLLGWTAAQLDSGAEDALSQVSSRLREYSVLFDEAGFAAVFERVSAQSGLDARLLAVEAGERTMTDLRHIAQLLNRAAVSESYGITALTRWMTDRIKEPAAGGSTDRSRRLDSDSAAVQIMTTHGSKGLEFPVVYLPYAWDTLFFSKPSTLLLHEDGKRIRDVGGPSGSGYAARKILNDQEEAGEELRLLYVGLTRAECRIVLWWAPGRNTATSSLHRMLFGRIPGIALPEPSYKVLDDATTANRLQSWVGSAAGLVSVDAVGPGEPSTAHWIRPEQPHLDVAAARFDRTLDLLWRRTSYSALTAHAHDAAPGRPEVGVTSEAEHPEKTDEPAETSVGGDYPGNEYTDEQLDGIASPMNGMPAGAAFGTLVHEALEHVDTSAPDLLEELERRCAAAVASRMAEVDPAALAQALLPVMQTPLGFGTLADVAPSDHLAELDFELPLAGGDDPVADTVTLKSVARLLRHHLDPADVLASYADLLDDLEATPLRGFLTGSIDSVLRVSGPRYIVVDYKTNRIVGGDLTTGNFTREKMAQEMIRSHYPLQAILYAVALHRYLRWRQSNYDPRLHLGGIRYLFVRGMVGPQTPAGCGVFDWNPPAALVVELSDLLAGKVAR
ncbi:AAA family ATPase [Rhodococcus sp. 06-462-5]|uniref:UvrD-helicase domain-containing protein n=1 Tax=unclassified Rhodococcus (in: high G+C Gram-positive bacteria) TaxID=192944 RepID=UPI000B9B41B3|nr:MULTISPECIES: UvrD-helicase domain-containing protein [unclassified Rhodococcus (in: high G+C Gram-positive bacteria)]OZC74296.1 AAA family ATPase [Rhodococcus sp. 06-462-5]OZE65078.1 AAA family ATPase [Rhodococcus sp. 02-925g]